MSESSETRGTYRAGMAELALGQMGAHTGRALGRQRLALGLSLNAVALAARMHPYTLARLERSDEPLDEARRAKIEGALRAVAQRRARELAREGWRERDMPSDLRAALRLYGSTEV